MTVFMGTRQRYQLARFEVHSWMSTVALLILLGSVLTFTYKNRTERPYSPIALGSVLVAASASKRGRGVVRRVCTEVFYGNLFKLTGVFYTTGANRVGG